MILFMPSDLIVMLTVATEPRAAAATRFTAAVPFILLTTLIAALPLLGFLLFHRRAVRAMPQAARLDEHEQLAGEHHRVRDLHHPDRRRAATAA